MLRKLFPLFFILLVLYGAGGYFFVFKMQKAALREEVNRKIHAGQFESEMVTFSVHSGKNLSSDGQTLVWEHEKEFAINGEWYDIVERQAFSADSVILKVLPDKNEKQVYALLARQAEQDPDDKGSPASRFLDFLHFSAIPNQFRLAKPFAGHTAGHSEAYFFALIPHSADILSPPPQVA